MNFSQRMGFEPASKPFQIESMDDDLRVGLWNVFDLLVLAPLSARRVFDQPDSRDAVHRPLFIPLWLHFFKWRLDELEMFPARAVEQVRTWFFQGGGAPWHKVYDFIEFVGTLKVHDGEPQGFRRACNTVMEREFSGYRFVGATIAPVTNEAEIQAIVQAATTDSSLLRPVAMHVEPALKLFANREKPEHRNSMKESISAVEALCKIIAEDDKATLGPALDKIRARVRLHPKQVEGFKALYGYTSDDHGIRHALKDDAEPEAEDAKYFLAICSAFVNYVTEKATKGGLLPV
jgi:hypothetical protein